MIEYFNGNDIRLLCNECPVNSLVVFTFSCLEKNPATAPPFGGKFLQDKNIHAIHFVAKRNHWWQTPEMDEAIQIIKGLTYLSDENIRMINYGSSMGGYGAIRFSKQLNSDVVIAVSPQFSIDRPVVPFEKRWAKEYSAISASEFGFGNDPLESGISNSSNYYVLFDPHHDDAQHVKMITNRLLEHDAEVKLISLPFSGHPTTKFLKEIGFISGMMNHLFGQTDFKNDLRTSRRKSRRKSAAYLANLAAVIEKRSGSSAALNLYEQACQLEPTAPALWYMKAKTLWAAKRYLQAAIAFKEVLRLDPNYKLAWHGLLRCHTDAGDWKAASELLRGRGELRCPIQFAAPLAAFRMELSGDDEAAAIDWLREQITSPKDIQTICSGALRLHRSGHLDSAISIYKLLLESDENCILAYTPLINALRKNGRKKEAVYYTSLQLSIA